MAIKRGRKPKPGVERYPSGQIKTDPRVLDAGEFVRMREAVQRHTLHHAWICELWRRAFFGQITNEMREAGDQYLKLRNEHLRVCEAPREHPKVASLEAGRGRSPEIDIDSMNQDERDREVHYRETVKRRWDRCCAELKDRHNGLRIWKATHALCVVNEHQAYVEFDLAKEGLLILAKHFGLTGRGRKNES